SNAKIAISEESMAEASRIFESKESDACLTGIENGTHNSDKPGGGQDLMPGFTRGGSKARIAISKESMAKATRILESKENDACSRRLENVNQSAKPAISQNSMLGFTRGGSKAKIAVSEESMAAASRILESKASDACVPWPENEIPNSAKPVGDLNLMLGFTRGGSKAKIVISDESMAAAGRILESKESDACVPRSENDNFISSKAVDCHNFMLGFTKGGSNAKIAISEESMVKANRILESKESDACVLRAENDNCISSKSGGGQNLMLGFTKGGSNARIAISEESMAKASRILESKESDACVPPPEGDNPISAKPGGGPNLMLGFTRGGSNAKIAISEESMAEASRILGSKENDARVPRPEDDNPISVKLGGFTRGGSNTRIAISEEYMAEASRILPCEENKGDGHSAETAGIARMQSDVIVGSGGGERNILGFSKGGSNATIAISEESMARAGCILESRDPACDSPRNELDSLEPIGSMAGNQRVRFSLDSETSRALVDGNILNGNSLTRKTTGKSTELTSKDCIVVANRLFADDHASKLTTSDECFNNDINLAGSALNRGVLSEAFVTPDKRGTKISGGGTQDECSQAKSQSEITAKTDIDCKPGAYHPDCENTDRNIVTDIKGTPGNTAGKQPSSSPHDANIFTPLHELTNISHGLQSVMKSKRLFENGKERKSSPVPTTKSGKDASSSWGLGSDFLDFRTLTLSQFAERHRVPEEARSWASCVEHGVKDVTMLVTSTNANKLRFDRDDGSPLFFLGQRNAPKCSHVGKVSDMRDWLSAQGCDCELFNDKWIQNHVRWIVWKLAAMERRFPIQLGGQYLTYSHILSQLKGRFEKELRGAKRPALRKILNRDVSAGMPIVLCISQILRFKMKVANSKQSVEELRLELTDGWYAVPALLDCVLTELVQKGKLQVGSKIFCVNAQLAGSDDGVDPLDDDYFPDRRTCPVVLKITANNTRLAKWDAKLGFVHPKHTSRDGGSLRVKSLNDIFPNGGAIPVIDLVVCKVYNPMYLEKVQKGKDTYTNHLTEAEESARQSEHDMSHQRASEKYLEAAQRECSEEVDEDAPSEWKSMMASNTPEEYYEKLGVDEKKIVEDWTMRRTVLLQSMVSKSIEDSLKDHSSSERSSVPYTKVVVKAFCHGKKVARNLERHGREPRINISAELTIWRATEEQLHLMKEGTVVRTKNLGVKSDSGILQLTANSDTQLEPLSTEPTHYQLIQSGYEERSPKSLLRINLMSKKMDTSRFEREVDVVACIVKIHQLDEHTSEAWLTDESGFVMKLSRNHSSENNDPFHLGITGTSLPAVVAYSNIQVTSFDATEQCASGQWCLLSCKARHLQFRCDELQTWCHSNLGMDSCSAILDRINGGLPMCAGPFNKHRVCVGYIMGFKLDSDSTASVVIDYGEDFLLTARFPLHLLPCALEHLSWNNFTSYDAESFCKNSQFLSDLSEFFRENQTLFHFLLEMVPIYGDDMPVLEVKKISLAAADALSRLHFTCGV
ncbi:hypothetical protein ACHAWF_008312, partial [Thalassiosira exigua]